MQLAPVDRYLINPGSVGQPRDGDWRAAFALYDSAMRPQSDLLPRSLRVQETQERILAADCPTGSPPG